MIMKKELKEPPLALVKTWISLIKSGESMEVKNMAAQKMVDAFGSIKNAADFCARNGISMK